MALATGATSYGMLRTLRQTQWGAGSRLPPTARHSAPAGPAAIPAAVAAAPCAPALLNSRPVRQPPLLPLFLCMAAGHRAPLVPAGPAARRPRAERRAAGSHDRRPQPGGEVGQAPPGARRWRVSWHGCSRGWLYSWMACRAAQRELGSLHHTKAKAPQSTALLRRVSALVDAACHPGNQRGTDRMAVSLGAVLAPAATSSAP